LFPCFFVSLFLCFFVEATSPSRADQEQDLARGG
jgi:hypothetical protein